MSKLWLFLSAVLDHWAVLMTGGLVTACLAVLQYWWQKTFSWRFHKWVIVVFLAYACFLAWREEYDRAQTFLEAKADLEGRLLERERRIEDLRSGKASEEQREAIKRLETANAQLESELRSSQQTLSALQASLKPRRLTEKERDKFTAALAAHDGRQFGAIEVTTSLGCQECMIYRDEIVKAINSVAGWNARSVVEMAIRADVTGLVIGVKDSNTFPPGAHVIAEALKAAELPFIISTIHFLSPDHFIFIVGNKP